MEELNNLGSYLRYYREKKGLSLQDVFNLTGISNSYVNRLETGARNNPSISVLKTLSSALDIPMLNLLEFIEPDMETANSKTSIAELIFFNEFNVNGYSLSLDEKKILIDIIEMLIDFDWNNNIKTKNSELQVLLDLVDKLKNLK